MKKTILCFMALVALAVVSVVGEKSTYASTAFDIGSQMRNMKTDIKNTLDIDVKLKDGEGSELKYKPEGFLAYVYLTSNDVVLEAPIDIYSSGKLDDLQNYYKNWLETNGFSDYSGHYIKYFDNDAHSKEIIICGNLEDDPGILRCNTVVSHDGVEDGYLLENKSMVNKLAVAYEKSGKDASKLVSSTKLSTGAESLLENMIIESEDYEGYSRIAVGMGDIDSPISGYVGLFYRVPAGDWTYFTGAQDILNCSLYNTPDLLKAFSGEVCYAEDGSESIVYYPAWERSSYNYNNKLDELAQKVKDDLGIELKKSKGHNVSAMPTGFKINIIVDDSLELTAPVPNDDLDSYFINWIEDEGFTKNDKRSNEYIKRYEKENTICQLLDYEIECGVVLTDKPYNYPEADKEIANKLAEALVRYGMSAEDVEGIIIGTNIQEIKSHEYEGYSKISVGMSSIYELAGGYRGLFFKTPANEWTYFTGTQSPLGCDLYNTPDLQKAFSGEICYTKDSEGHYTDESVVKFIEKGDITTPDTGDNIQEDKSWAIRLTFIGLPILLILGYLIKYIHSRITHRVRFTER